jgi:hypothetical protein
MDHQSAQQVESRQAYSARHSHLYGLYWAILLLPVLYVLSIGPAAKLADVGVVSDSIVETVYRPLVLATKHSNTFRKAMFWYLHDLWRCKLN